MIPSMVFMVSEVPGYVLKFCSLVQVNPSVHIYVSLVIWVQVQGYCGDQEIGGDQGGWGDQQGVSNLNIFGREDRIGV